MLYPEIVESDSKERGLLFKLKPLLDKLMNCFQDLLEAVVPFDVLLDRRKRSNFLNTLGQDFETQKRPKVVHDAGIALASLVICEEALEQELIISTSYVLFPSLFAPCSSMFNHSHTHNHI